jgi:transposase-like protein
MQLNTQEVKSLLIKDKVAERLRKGTPFAEVRKEFSSTSQLYAGARQYLEKADKEITLRQERLEELSEATIEKEERNAELEQENANLTKDNMVLAQKKLDLTEEVAQKEEKLRYLDAARDKLRSQGYSPEIMEKIGEIEERSGPQLLSELETVEKFKKTRKAFQTVKRKKRIAEGELQEIQTKKTETEKAVISEANRLDELKMETAVHKESIEVVKEFERDGYTAVDLRLLKDCVDNLQIKDDPTLSISRLAEGLQMEKDLISLKDRAENERKSFRKFKKAKVETENEIEILKKTGIGTIEATKNAGVKAINNVAESAKTAMLAATKKFETRTDEHLKKCENHIQRSMEKVKGELQEFAEFQKEKAKFEDGMYLVTLLVVSSLHVQRQDPYLLSGRHRLGVLLKLVAEGLRQRMSEMTQKSEI